MLWLRDHRKALFVQAPQHQAGYPEADDYYGKMDGKEEELPVPENPGIRHGVFYG